MSSLVYGWRSFHEFLTKHGDAHTNHWFLMTSPFPTLALVACYLYIVKSLGPRLMKNRKPFELKTTLLYYNLFQVILSTYLFYEAGMSGWLTGEYSWRCQPVDRTASPSAIRMRSAAWWYFFSKLTEFFDTFFFIMRKKDNQVSSLHVFHHSVLPIGSWIGVKLVPNGHGTFFGFLNTFVHIVMYSYYFLAALGPNVQKYLWWKKYLTGLQLAQFTAISLHAVQLLFIDCDYPRVLAYLIVIAAVVFFVLFRSFYVRTYTKPKVSDKLQGGRTSIDGGLVGSTTSSPSHEPAGGHTEAVKRRHPTRDI